MREQRWLICSRTTSAPTGASCWCRSASQARWLYREKDRGRGPLLHYPMEAQGGLVVFRHPVQLFVPELLL